MSLRFQSQLQIDSIPDSQLENQFEVIMPTLSLLADKSSNWTSISGILNKTGLSDYTPIVEEITFGVKNFTTDTRRVRTGWCNVPADIENYRDVVITFYCSSGMLIQYYLAAWKNLIFNSDGEYYNPMKVYKKNIEVYFYGAGNLGAIVPEAAHYTLKGCFPYSQEVYKLSYSNEPQRLRVTQSFKVDAIVADSNNAKSSIISETITSPMNALGNIASNVVGSLFGSEEAGYSPEDVYK